MTRGVTKMTRSVVPPWCEKQTRRQGLRRFNGCGINQQDGDVVLNGVDAAAYAAFQAFAVFFQDHRFLANRADEDVEKILRNHSDIIVRAEGSREQPLQLG